MTEDQVDGNLKGMDDLDSVGWNNADWTGVFAHHHTDDVLVDWKGQPPTHGIDQHIDAMKAYIESAGGTPPQITSHPLHLVPGNGPCVIGEFEGGGRMVTVAKWLDGAITREYIWSWGGVAAEMGPAGPGHGHATETVLAGGAMHAVGESGCQFECLEVVALRPTGAALADQHPNRRQHTGDQSERQQARSRPLHQRTRHSLLHSVITSNAPDQCFGCSATPADAPEASAVSAVAASDSGDPRADVSARVAFSRTSFGDHRN
jgi:hypothetical protein